MKATQVNFQIISSKIQAYSDKVLHSLQSAFTCDNSFDTLQLQWVDIIVSILWRMNWGSRVTAS
jgi:hypothetical protein